MKLYTKRGDKGQTDLFGGQQATKNHPRVHAYGQVDELNAHLGLALTACSVPFITQTLTRMQHDLFELGADLATPHDSPHADKVNRIAPADIAWAEQAIDEACQRLPEMKSFILPGGCELASHLHVARCVCRRAERDCVTLAGEEDIGPHVVIYLNRASDLLFALARLANLEAGLDDVPWTPSTK